MTTNSKAAPTSPSPRIVFVDQTRALAIMLMLVGHSLDRFLAEPWRSGPVYENYQFVRGISSTLFLTISGFSFVIASFGHFEDYTRWSPRMMARVRRMALIIFLGYVLNLWASTLSQSINTFGPTNLERFLKFDVLQNIAFGLAALHGLMWITGSPHKFGKAILPVAIAIFCLGFVTYRPEIDAMLPASISSMVNMYHQSRFPVVPYTGFLLIGATFGYWFWKKRQTGEEHKVFIAALGAAALLIAFEVFLRNGIDGGIFPYSTPAKKMPGNTFARAGCALIIISGFYYLSRLKILASKLAFILSKDAMLIYFVHLLIVYGVSSLPKFAGLSAESMSPLKIWSFIACLATSMGLLAALSGWLRKNKLTAHRLIRQSMILGGILVFTTSSHLTIIKIAASLAVSTALVVIVHRFRIRSSSVPNNPTT